MKCGYVICGIIHSLFVKTSIPYKNLKCSILSTSILTIVLLSRRYISQIFFSALKKLFYLKAKICFFVSLIRKNQIYIDLNMFKSSLYYHNNYHDESNLYAFIYQIILLHQTNNSIYYDSNKRLANVYDLVIICAWLFWVLSPFVFFGQSRATINTNQNNMKEGLSLLISKSRTIPFDKF